ncbi:MAG: hypothetical protein WBA76_10905 [Phormidesmis sp.]
MLTKPTLDHSSNAELDELLLNLTIKSEPTPVRQILERYAAEEFPGWTMRDWRPTKDVFDKDKPL